MPSVFFISLMSASSWGGSEELWYRCAMLAAKKGWKVGCAVYHWPAKEIKLQPLADAGATIYYLPNKGKGKKNLAELFQNKLSKFRAKKYISDLPVEMYDVAVINQGAFEITTPAWKHFYRRLKNYVVLYHNYREGETFKDAKAQTIQNWIDHSSLNLFASKKIIEVLQKNSIRIQHDEILINPISFPAPSQPATYPTLRNGRYNFIVLAALEVNRKAQDNLIRVLSSAKWKERNWQLELYGEGPDESMLSQLIDTMKMQDRIFLKGHSGNVQAVLQDAHLLLQLTKIDAMPLSVVEAMAMARPVAATMVGDMPEWVEDGVNGWVGIDASEQEIDRTLEKAWQQREQWDRMGALSFARFKLKFIAEPEERLLDQIESSIVN